MRPIYLKKVKIKKRGNRFRVFEDATAKLPEMCIRDRYKTWYEKGRVLECNWKTTNNFYNANKDTNKEMLRWLLKNVLLSFDVIYGKLNEIYFTRYGVLGLLPVYEREIEQEKLHKLSEYNVPFLQSANSRRALSHKYYSIVCPIEYKDVVNAIADDQPIPCLLYTSRCV